MTKNLDPYENALAERMNITIKEEFIIVEKIINLHIARQLLADQVKLIHTLYASICRELLTHDLIQ